MKLKRKLLARWPGLKVEISVLVESQKGSYFSDEMKEKRRDLVEGIYDLLRSKLGFDIEEISLK